MFPDKLHLKIGQRHFSGSLRELTIADRLVDFSSNDYLGFSQSPVATDSSGSGSTGSRLISGNSKLHEDVENQIALFHDCEAALLFNSGYDANLGLITAITDRHDMILYDHLVHASIRDGISLSKAKALRFQHNDLDHLEILLNKFSQAEDRVVYVITESVFSMDGDTPDLVELTSLCNKFKNVCLIVDEAHSLGVHGKKGEGLVQNLGLQEQVFARVVTFGKSLGTHGAAVLGSRHLREFLINFARSFIYTTALPQHTVKMIQHNYKKLKSDQAAHEQLRINIKYFRKQIKSTGFQLQDDITDKRCDGLSLRFRESVTPIQICIMKGNVMARKAALHLQQNGYDVRAILSPTVPKGQERLRICLHAHNTKKEIRGLLKSLKVFADKHA